MENKIKISFSLITLVIVAYVAISVTKMVIEYNKQELSVLQNSCPYTTEDIVLTLEHIKGNIILDDNLFIKYDINKDNVLDVTDVECMLNIIKGENQ